MNKLHVDGQFNTSTFYLLSENYSIKRFASIDDDTIDFLSRDLLIKTRVLLVAMRLIFCENNHRNKLFIEFVTSHSTTSLTVMMMIICILYC